MIDVCTIARSHGFKYFTKIAKYNGFGDKVRKHYLTHIATQWLINT